MPIAAPAMIASASVAQLGAVAVFLTLAAVEGDSLGIARGMAVLMAGPFLLLTLPAILLARRGHPIVAGALAAVSLAVSWYAWAFA